MQSAKLVHELRSRSSMPLDDIASLLGVSARTARAYIHDTNASLGPVAHIGFSRQHGGYELQIDDELGLDSWLSRMGSLDGADGATSQEARVAYLMNDLLSRSDWVTLSTLASVLYVTPQRISGDLKVVADRLARFGLTIERKPRYGIRVTGDEVSRRLCMASLASKGSLANALAVDDGDSQQMLARITSCLNAVLDEQGFPMGALAFQNLVVYVYVALVRIRENCYVPMESAQLSRVRETDEYGVARKAADAICDATGVALPEEEVAYIAIHLAGKRALNDLVIGGEPEDGGDLGVISDEVWNVVGEMLGYVYEHFKFDFRGDLELRMNLARHLVPLSVRLTFHMHIDNPVLNDMRTRFPLAYAMALESGVILERAWGTRPSEEETGYLAMAFALALERQRGEMPKKNILVVCASGQGSARMLEARYRREFGDYIGMCVACDVASAEHVDFSDIDYVFTTVSLPFTPPVPVREVTYFLDSAEIGNIRQILGGVRNEEGAFSALDPRLFFPHLEISDKSGVISFLCDRAEEHRRLDSDFRDKVRRREEAAPTSFGNLVAMPHPIEVASDDTFACIGLLDRPVVWDECGTKVQAVFLVFFSQEGGADQEEFFSRLADLFMNEDAMRRLLRRQDWKTFIREFEGGR